MSEFPCTRCGKTFSLPEEVLARYPGWVPKLCSACKRAAPASKGRKAAGRGGAPAAKRRGGTQARSATAEEDLSLAEVLARYHGGPQDGVFTDGAAHPNPGAGGWGAVYVVGGEIVAERSGHEPHTTNNRMELTALIEGYQLVPEGTPAVVWTDSNLCVNTITRWAAGWKRNGWKRKTGAIKNLELVQELYELAQARPELELRWIEAHSGNRWNEYADALATAYRRSVR